MTKRILLFLPLAMLVAFLATVGWRLINPADNRIESRLVGKPVPAFALPPLLADRPGLSSADLVGGRAPRLVNLFASWCVPCIAEAPLLEALKREGVAIDAIAVRDRPEGVLDFLNRHGDPYQRIGSDPDSRAQLALGASGVPETYVIDRAGLIRYQHIGPIGPGDLATIRAELAKAR